MNVHRMRPHDPVTWLLTTISPSIGRRPDATALGPVRHALGFEDPMRQETRLVSHCMWPPPGGLGLRACVTMQRTSLPAPRAWGNARTYEHNMRHTTSISQSTLARGTEPFRFTCPVSQWPENTIFVNDAMCVSNPRTLSGNSYCEDAYLLVAFN